MIDIHSHLLPNIDDGAVDMATAIEMAELAYSDGIRGIICTPHVKVGVYDNTSAIIKDAVRTLRDELQNREIGIELFVGADVHIAPDLKSRFEAGQVPTLAKSRYFLLEPSHHVLTPRMGEFAAGLIGAGFVPIVTHPERLSWISNHYSEFVHLNEAGCLVQITAGSITGNFGKYPQYYAEKMLDEGRVDIVATDAHDPVHRPPILSKARDVIAKRLGSVLADDMVLKCPMAILTNQPLRPVGQTAPGKADLGPSVSLPQRRSGLMGRLLKGAS